MSRLTGSGTSSPRVLGLVVETLELSIFKRSAHLLNGQTVPRQWNLGPLASSSLGGN